MKKEKIITKGKAVAISIDWEKEEISADFFEQKDENDDVKRKAELFCQSIKADFPEREFLSTCNEEAKPIMVKNRMKRLGFDEDLEDKK